jgi:hypothetical protein
MGAVQWFLFGFCFEKGRLELEKRRAGNGRGDKGMKKENDKSKRGSKEGRRWGLEMERRPGMRIPACTPTLPAIP